MARKFAKLEWIEFHDPINSEKHYEFLYQLQSALLLALREKGSLSPMQYRHALEKLNKQRRDRARQKLEEP